jgi:serine/threonine-protein kinase
LLGGIELRGAPSGVADELLSQSKAVALLAYLALSPDGRFQRRDRLIGLLWPELDQAHARTALRQALFKLRSSLGTDVLATRGNDELTIAPAALRCDVVEFTSAAESGRLARALELYRGDLMPGFFLGDCVEFERWLEDERTIARERAAAASWALAVALESDQQLTAAGSWARRAVRHASTDERVLRRAVQMLERLGDRAGAVKLYEDFAARLRADLNVEPSPETRALMNAIRLR